MSMRVLRRRGPGLGPSFDTCLDEVVNASSWTVVFGPIVAVGGATITNSESYDSTSATGEISFTHQSGFHTFNRSISSPCSDAGRYRFTFDFIDATNGGRPWFSRFSAINGAATRGGVVRISDTGLIQLGVRTTFGDSFNTAVGGYSFGTYRLDVDRYYDVINDYITSDLRLYAGATLIDQIIDIGNWTPGEIALTLQAFRTEPVPPPPYGSIIASHAVGRIVVETREDPPS